MGMSSLSYSGYRFPADVIQRAVWLYMRFTLSYRDLEELLAELGLEASYETIRHWVHTFGPATECVGLCCINLVGPREGEIFVRWLTRRVRTAC
jgi:hypothetical protein